MILKKIKEHSSLLTRESVTTDNRKKETYRPELLEIDRKIS